MSREADVRAHFDADAARFDEIYDEHKGPVGWFIDEVWRGVVRKRFDLTVERLSPLERRRVLDVGCGSGRYCVAFAVRGAERVVGLELAPAMLALAEGHAEAAGVDGVCDFRLARFPDEGIEAGESFDASTAMGYFDYVSDPAPHLARMRELTSGTIVASFPKARDFRAPLRRLRFKLNRCPLFLYTRPGVESLLATAGIRDYELIDLDRDYILFARV